MNKRINLVAVLCLSPFLLQCVAAQKDVRGLDLRTRTIDNRLIDIEHDVESLQNKSAGQAEMGEMIDQLNTRLLKIEGQLDESTHVSRRFQDESVEWKQDVNSHFSGVKMQLADLQSKIEALNSEIGELKTKNERLTEQLALNAGAIGEVKEARAREAAERAAAAARAAQKAKEKAESVQTASLEPREIVPAQTKKKVQPEPKEKAEKKPSTTTVKPAAKPSPKPAAKAATGAGSELYDKGISQYRQKNYKQAYSSFAEYLEKFPNGPMAADARFWLGESLYSQKEYELAILEYQKIIADFPSHPNAPAGLLKQGMAFEKLKENDTARIVYKKLINEYPKSKQAGEAKKLLSALK